MVPNNHKDRQSLPKSKTHKVETNEGDLQNWGIPLTVITKEQFRQKKRDNKIKKKRGRTNPQTKKK